MENDKKTIPKALIKKASVVISTLAFLVIEQF